MLTQSNVLYINEFFYIHTLGIYKIFHIELNNSSNLKYTKILIEPRNK